MSEENKKNKDDKKSKILLLVTVISILFVLLLFVCYWMWLPEMQLDSHPDNKIQITGTFGDSFGFLTCLFSGLSSVGMIVAILMQREELQLQRQELADNRGVLEQQKEEFKKSAKAQENSVKLSSLMILFKEEEKEIDRNQQIIKDYTDKEEYDRLIDFKHELGEEEFAYYSQRYEKAKKRQPILYDRRESIISEIEKITIELGVNLSQLPK